MRMSNNVLMGKDARKALMDGINLVADAVKGTLGANPTTAVIGRGSKLSPLVLNDGVSIVSSIESDDPYINIGVKLIQEVARQAQKASGDGTTTATIVARALCEEANRLLDTHSHLNPMDLYDQVSKDFDYMVQLIREQTVPLDDDKIVSVATVSANNDLAIGSLIAEIFLTLGKDCSITLEPSFDGETKYRLVDGFNMPSGMVSPMFANVGNKCVLDNPVIIMAKQTVTEFEEITPALEIAIGESRPILFIVDNMKGVALNNLLVNTVKGIVNCAVVRVAGYGEGTDEWFGDLSAITQGHVFSGLEGDSIVDAQKGMGHFGSAKKVEITKDSITFIADKSNDLSSHIDTLEEEIREAEHEFDIEKLHQRIARLEDRVAVISVGGDTDLEVTEKRERIDDAINAVRLAYEGGISAGGGVLPMWLSGKCETLVLQHGLREPMKQLLANCNSDWKWDSKTPHIGFNCKSKRSGYLFDMGIIDPTEVIVNSLTSAVSIFKLILLTDTIVVRNLDGEV